MFTAQKNSDFEAKILKMLSGRLMSVSQVAKELKIRRDVATGYLEALKNQGKLDFHRVARSNVYTTIQRKNRKGFFQV